MPTQTTARSARQKLLDAASRLFYARGVAATGIDAVTAEAGVAKMSLYNNFSSKDDLILAYIEARHAEWLALYHLRLAKAQTLTERVLAVFDAYLDHAQGSYEYGFRGCGLLNAAAELPAGSAGREAVRRHKEHIETILHEHLENSNRPGAADLAEHFSFLLEGAMSRAGLEGRPDKIATARAIAKRMMDAQ